MGSGRVVSSVVVCLSAHLVLTVDISIAVRNSSRVATGIIGLLFSSGSHFFNGSFFITGLHRGYTSLHSDGYRYEHGSHSQQGYH